MSKRRISEEKIREMQMKSGGRGPGGRFGGLREKPKNMKETIKRLLHYLAHSKTIFIALLIITLFNTFFNLYNNLLIKDIIASLGEFNPETGWFTPGKEPNSSLFMKSLITVGVVSLLHCILQYFSSVLGAYLSQRTILKMRKDLFDKIAYLPISYVDRHPHGDIMSRMTNDVDNVTNAISSSLTSLVNGVITVVGCLAIMIFYSPLLTLVSLVVLVLTLLFTRFMSKHMRPLFVKQQGILGILNSQTEEMVTGCKTVMAYNRQQMAEEEFNEQSDLLTKTGIIAQILGGSMGPVMNFIGNVGYFAVCLFGALFISWGVGGTLLGQALDVSIVIMFLTLTKQFTRPINEIAQVYTSLINALAGAERVFKILDTPGEDFSFKQEFDAEKIKGDIDFKHVAFGYYPDKPVLKDFHVDVYSGHKIALVGATGSGKTTIVNLLLRFYDIDSGAIEIDGINIKDISKKDLRDAIAIVLQDPVLFGDSIENNIRYGRLDATNEEIDGALKFANCDSFVYHLPEGKKTILTEGAANISQGQRQLLTIARAVIANPKILILDEATSSVDTRTEKKIQDAMVKLMENRTSIIIAHRLSTIQDADLIVVLDQGRVVEMGNHEELIALGGKYNTLYQTQFKGLET